MIDAQTLTAAGLALDPAHWRPGRGPTVWSRRYGPKPEWYAGEWDARRPGDTGAEAGDSAADPSPGDRPVIVRITPATHTASLTLLSHDGESGATGGEVRFEDEDLEAVLRMLVGNLQDAACEANRRLFGGTGHDEQHEVTE
jgi:hypothetical protein